MEAKHEIKQNIVQRLHDERTDGRTSNIRCPSIYPFIYSKMYKFAKARYEKFPGLSNILFGGHLFISYSLKFYNLTYIIYILSTKTQLRNSFKFNYACLNYINISTVF